MNQAALALVARVAVGSARDRLVKFSTGDRAYNRASRQWRAGGDGAFDMLQALGSGAFPVCSGGTPAMAGCSALASLRPEGDPPACCAGVATGPPRAATLVKLGTRPSRGRRSPARRRRWPGLGCVAVAHVRAGAVAKTSRSRAKDEVARAALPIEADSEMALLQLIQASTRSVELAG